MCEKRRENEKNKKKKKGKNTNHKIALYVQLDPCNIISRDRSTLSWSKVYAKAESEIET